MGALYIWMTFFSQKEKWTQNGTELPRMAEPLVLQRGELRCREDCVLLATELTFLLVRECLLLAKAGMQG